MSRLMCAIFSVFLVCCNGDIFRQMVLLSKDLGMAVGEYAFLFFYSIPGDPMLGDYSWRRGDDLDLVKRNLTKPV